MRHIFSILSRAVVAQVLNSGSNFLFTLIIARQFSLSEFGVYGVWFAVAILLAGVGNSIIHTQVAVNYFSKKSNDQDAYVARMFLGLLGLSFVLIIFCGLICTVFYIYGFFDDAIYVLGWCACITMLGFSLKDYCVRVAYTKQNQSLVVNLNFITGSALVFFGILLVEFEFFQNASWGLVFYGVSNILAFLYFYIFEKFDFKNLTRDFIVFDITEAWCTGGKWFLFVTFANAIQSQFYTFVVAGALGVKEVALMNVARIMFMPPIVMIPVVNQIFLPKFINSKNAGLGYLGGRLVSYCMVTGAVVYSILIWGVSDSLLLYFLNSDSVGGLDLYLLAWCFAVLAMASKVSLTIENHANKDFKNLFLITIFSGIIALLFSWLLIKLIGGPGAVFALSIGDFILCYLLYRNSKLVRGTA